METIYFKQPYLQLYYNQETQTARAVWSGFLSSAEIQTACFICIKLLEELNPKNWLADNRKMKAIRQRDQEWIIAELAPRLANSSLRKMATMVSEDIFNQMAIENIYTRAGQSIKFEHQYFKQEEAAAQWLQQDFGQNKKMKMA